MRKVLILAYDFPPYISVGGLRPYSWYKYFLEFSIHPIVVTRQWNNKHGNHLDYIESGESEKTIIENTGYGTLIKTPYNPNFPNRLMLKYGNSRYKLLRKFISAYYDFIQFIFITGPKSNLYFTAREYLKNNDVDFIIASGDPFVLFNYASILSMKFKIPWIADYRDPWSQDNTLQNNFFLKIRNSFLEKKIVKTSHLIITVSDYVKEKISADFPNKRILIISNGYDPEAIDSVNEVNQQHSIFSIAIVGTIYMWHPLERFLMACCEFLKKTENIGFRINFYGVNKEDHIRFLISTKYQMLEKIINIYLKMPNEVLIQKLAEENCLVLFNDYDLVGTKIYDYIGVKRCILFCFNDDREANELKKNYYHFNEDDSKKFNPQADIIKRTNSGIIVNDAAHLSLVLQDLYSEFKSSGYVECNSTNTEQFSRKTQILKLAEIINNND